MDKAGAVLAGIIKLFNLVDNDIFKNLCIISWSQK